MNARVDGLTIGWRIPISLCEGGRGRCNGSDKCEVCRNSQQSTALSTIILTRNVTYTADKITRKTEPLRWPSGGSFASTDRRVVRKTETGCLLYTSDAADDLLCVDL